MWNREKQSLLQARTRRLRIAENKVQELRQENRAVYEENKDLRFENEEIIELLTEIADRAFCCPLDSEKIVLDKIKELVRDYQSKN